MNNCGGGCRRGREVGCGSPAVAGGGLADGGAREQGDCPRDSVLPILDHSLDPGVDGACAPFETLADLAVDIHDLACSVKHMAVLKLEEVLQRAEELLGLCNKVKDLHHRNKHCSGC